MTSARGANTAVLNAGSVARRTTPRQHRLDNTVLEALEDVNHATMAGRALEDVNHAPCDRSPVTRRPSADVAAASHGIVAAQSALGEASTPLPPPSWTPGCTVARMLRAYFHRVSLRQMGRSMRGEGVSCGG
jgi:hypothetical protein